MMETSTSVIYVGSRESQLALIQTNKIISHLKRIHPDVSFEIVKIKTIGDKILDTALAKIGEKSLFTKELEEALLAKKVQFVVHSLKDLPTVLPEGLVIGAVYKRDDPRDAVVMHPQHKDQTLATLPLHSVIGTSSARRTAQLKKAFPNLVFKDIRGNLNTRLRKLDSGVNNQRFDAIILAVAGLQRMGWGDRISQILEPDTCMYSVSQGAMAVECRRDDTHTLSLLSCLQDYESTLRCTAERSFLKTLEGGCSVPVCVDTIINDNELSLKGAVYNLDGTECVVDSLSVELPEQIKDLHQQDPHTQDFASIIPNMYTPDSLQAAYQLGSDLADKVIKDGAGQILKDTKKIMAAAIIEEQARKRQKLDK